MTLNIHADVALVGLNRVNGLGPPQLRRYTSNRFRQVALMIYNLLKAADRSDITSSIKPDLFYSDGFQSEGFGVFFFCVCVFYDLQES